MIKAKFFTSKGSKEMIIPKNVANVENYVELLQYEIDRQTKIDFDGKISKAEETYNKAVDRFGKDSKQADEKKVALNKVSDSRNEWLEKVRTRLELEEDEEFEAEPTGIRQISFVASAYFVGVKRNMTGFHDFYVGVKNYSNKWIDADTMPNERKQELAELKEKASSLLNDLFGNQNADADENPLFSNWSVNRVPTWFINELASSIRGTASAGKIGVVQKYLDEPKLVQQFVLHYMTILGVKDANKETAVDIDELTARI